MKIKQNDYAHITELPEIIVGRGEVSGFTFRMLMKTNAGYIYQVTHPFIKKPHYEVFLRKINHRFCIVSYPKSNSFGIWAWQYPTLAQARRKLDSLSTSIVLP